MSFLSRFRSREAAPSETISSEDAADKHPFRSTARSHVGKIRALNEDRFVAMPEASLWAIADGMGGHSAGDVAAELVAQNLRACASHTPVTVDKVMAAIRSANAELVTMNEDRGRSDISGSTVVALIIQDDLYCCLWAGDSRAYLYRDGQCQRISRDHSVVQEMVDAGVITAGDASSHPNAHIITRAVGVAPSLQIDVSRGVIEAGDMLLLCSDGLSDLVGVDRIEACLAQGEIEQMADSLLAAGLETGAPDNISFIIIQAPKLLSSET